MSKPLLNGDSGELSSPNLPDKYIYIHRGLSSLYYRYRFGFPDNGFDARVAGDCHRHNQQEPMQDYVPPSPDELDLGEVTPAAVTGWLLKNYNWIRRVCNDM